MIRLRINNENEDSVGGTAVLDGFSIAGGVGKLVSDWLEVLNIPA